MNNSSPPQKSGPVCRLLKRAFIISCVLLSSGAAHAQEDATVSGLFIRDGGILKSFDVARDEVVVLTKGSGAPSVSKISPRNSIQQLQAEAEKARASMKGTQGGLVLWERGRPRSDANRRVIGTKVLVHLRPNHNLALMARDTVAARFERVTYAQNTAIFHATDSADALRLMAVLRAHRSVASANVLLGRSRAKKLVPNDTYFSYNVANRGYQWHLRNTGQNGSIAGNDVNITTVWDTWKGNGIKIGIVDDGLQTSHPDLSPNVDTTIDYDFADDDGDPSPPSTNDDHGTACAGVAAARGNNSLGTCGSAPEGTLVGLRIDLSLTDDLMEADALSHHNDVIPIKSNSWGAPDDGSSLGGLGDLAAAALENGTTNGRGGLGTVYVWAAGNGADVGDDSNYDSYANSIHVIAVAALSDQALPAWYSEPGANIAITAPSSGLRSEQKITTTDLVGTQGSNAGGSTTNLTDSNYTNNFGGTSSATPLVSGCVALLLQSKPTLGWRDVKEILMASSTVIDTGDSDWTTNSGGFHFNHKYGAGRINVQAAVTLASTWTNLGAMQSDYRDDPAFHLPIPDDSPTGVTHTFHFTGTSLRTEHVTLRVNIDHARRGDLDLVLVAPSGMSSRLAWPHDDEAADYTDYTFSSVRHWGENCSGIWKLIVSDRVAGNTGTLTSAKLTIYGTSATTPSGAPVITSATAATGSFAKPFRYQITASNRPAGFFAVGLPSGLSINTSTGLISGTPAAGTSSITIGAGNGSGSGSATLTLTVATLPTLADAVDNPAHFWWSGGNASWTRTTTVANTHDGIDAGRSGTTLDSQQSWLKAVTEGPAVLTYWWKVSSEQDYDYLDFYDNGENAHFISGAVAYTKVTRYLPPGRHTLEWNFNRDESAGSGSNAGWVDEISVLSLDQSPPVITSQPNPFHMALGGRARFSIKAVGQATLSYQWKKGGVDISGATSPVLLIDPVTAGDAASYTCTVTNGLGSVTSNAATLTITNATLASSLATALDEPLLIWGTGGNSNWLVQNTVTSDGVDAAQSGVTADFEYSSLYTTAVGPAWIYFNWKSSSENFYDFLGVYVDDRYETNISGEPSDFSEDYIYIGPGVHSIEFSFVRDGSDAGGLNTSWLDQVRYVPASYARWADLQFTPSQLITPGFAGPYDDPNSDGVKNLMAYALNIPPLTDALPYMPSYTVSGGNLLFDFTRDLDKTDIIYQPETSPSLLDGSWMPASFSTLGITGTVESLQVQLPLNGLEQFVRLNVVPSP